MKKTTFISTLAMAFLMLFSFNVNAQEFPKLDKSPMDAASFPSSYKEANKLIKIVYSRPQLNDRDLERLIPNGKVWRTGANEAAEITFYKDMMFGKTNVPAGTYTFYILVEGGQWTGIISKDVNVWGSYSYNKENDVARFSARVATSKEKLEAFSIVFDGDKNAPVMHLGWGNSRASFPFTRI